MKVSFRVAVIALTVVLTAVALGSLLIGAAGLPVRDALSALFSFGDQSVASTIVWEVRIPRIAAGIVVGIATALAGVVLQSTFANPLAEPSLIGISGMAGVGAILVGVVVDSLPLQTLGGVAAASLAMLWLTRQQVSRNAFLILGIAVGSLATSVLGALASSSLGSDQRSLIAWLFGSLSLATYEAVLIVLMAVAVAVVALRSDLKILDIVSLGERQAAHLGVAVTSYKRKWLVLAAILIGCSVAAFGIISFVGLLVPHIARGLGFTLHKQLLVISGLLGGILVVIADSLARVVAAPIELPLSLVLAAFGAPVLITIIKRGAQ